MKTKSFADMQCSIARSLELVGNWWSFLIIRDAMMGARRFKHFEKSLGIAKNTLTNRLTKLVESGVLKKVPAEDGSAFEEYVLTDMGRELAPVMMALAQWGDKWAVHQDGPLFTFIDEQTEEEVTRIWPRREDGEMLPLNEISVKPLSGSGSGSGSDSDGDFD